MKGKPLIEKRKAGLALAAAAILILASGAARIVEGRVLRADWRRIAQAAAAEGIALRGELPAESLFGRSSLPVADVTVADAARALRIRAPLIALDRPLLRLFRLTVSVPDGVDVTVTGGGAWHVWGHSLAATRMGEAWRIEGLDLAAAIDGSGPDDVTAIGAVDATVSPIPGSIPGPISGAGGIRIAAHARAVLLPLHGTWALGRKVEEGSLSALLSPTSLRIDQADASWAGQYARVSATLSRDGGGLNGAGRFTLGPGWAASIRRAREAGALTVGKARALIGVLGLLESDDRAPVNVTFDVRRNMVTVGEFRLLDLSAANPAPGRFE